MANVNDHAPPESPDESCRGNENVEEPKSTPEVSDDMMATSSPPKGDGDEVDKEMVIADHTPQSPDEKGINDNVEENKSPEGSNDMMVEATANSPKNGEDEGAEIEETVNASPESPDESCKVNENIEDPKSPEVSNQSDDMMVMATATSPSPPPKDEGEGDEIQEMSGVDHSPPQSPDDSCRGNENAEGLNQSNDIMATATSPPPPPPAKTEGNEVDEEMTYVDDVSPESPDESSKGNENTEEPKSPEGSNQSDDIMATATSPPPPTPPKAEAEGDEAEEEDLEDGEIEDEEEEEMEVEEFKVVESKKEVVKSSRRESSSGKSSSSKSKDKEKSSEKKSKRDKDKESSSKREELDPVKRLLAEVKEKDNLEKEEREKRRKDKKRPHKEEKVDKSKEKESPSKKKKPKMSEEEDEGEEFLFVRGASPGMGGSNDNWDAIDLDRRGSSSGKRRRDSDDGASPSSHRHRRGHEGSSSPTRNNRVVERPKSQRQERREPKSDVICAYFMQGKCQKSADQCNFSHDAVPPRKMELCKFWMMECCAKKEKCIYLHNDFPCKYFHTGLVCRMGDNCKFSHNPLTDVIKQVLLKHIETAPKEILGDFPRLNRTGALNLINKMEAKLKGLPYVEEDNNENEMMNHGGGPPHHGYGGGQDRHGGGGGGTDRHGGGPDRHGGGGPERFQDRHHHNNDRSRDNNSRGHFGGPGHHDSNNSRGGIGRGRGGGERGLLGMPPPDIHRGAVVDNRDRRQSRWEQSQPTRVDQEKLKELMNEAGISGFYKDTMEEPNNDSRPHPGPPQLPVAANQSAQMFPPQLQNMQPPLMGMLPSYLLSQVQAQQVNNPALANVLAQLQIPSTSIVPTQFPPPFDPGAPTTTSVNQGDEIKSQKSNDQPSDSGNSGIPENLPKMQRELFERIQQQQKKNQNKVQTQVSSEPEEPEENWYSDDEEEDSKKKEELKAEINDQISSVLNQIRQQSQQQAQSSTSKKEPESLKTFFGDTDLRSSNTDFKDVDLRTSSALFKKINILPATEINASFTSHEPVEWKVYVVMGALDKPDYSSIRRTLTPQAILMDPRLGPRRRRSNSIPAPESPTLDMHSASDGLNQSQPMGGILDVGTVFDPRTMKAGGGGGQLSGGRGLLETPNPFDTSSMPGMNMHMNMNDFNNPFNRDPRSSGGNPPTHTQPPPNPGNAAQMAQNFAAVSALMQQQWPNGQPPIDPSLFMLGLSSGFPFMPQAQGSGSQSNPGLDFTMMQQNPHGMRMRPPFMPGNQGQQSSSNHQQQAPPASSWERFNRGQGNLSPPL